MTVSEPGGIDDAVHSRVASDGSCAPGRVLWGGHDFTSSETETTNLIVVAWALPQVPRVTGINCEVNSFCIADRRRTGLRKSAVTCFGLETSALDNMKHTVSLHCTNISLWLRMRKQTTRSNLIWELVHAPCANSESDRYGVRAVLSEA